MRRIVARPLLGRLRPALAPPPYRFWRIANSPYLIVDNAARGPPLVLRVLHMIRDLPPLLAAWLTWPNGSRSRTSRPPARATGADTSQVPDLGRSARRKPAAGHAGRPRRNSAAARQPLDAACFFPASPALARHVGRPLARSGSPDCA